MQDRDFGDAALDFYLIFCGLGASEFFFNSQRRKSYQE